MNIWLFFGAVLLGALVGSIITNWFNNVAQRLGMKKMMDEGDMFVRHDGEWSPHSPYKPTKYPDPNCYRCKGQGYFMIGSDQCKCSCWREK